MIDLQVGDAVWTGTHYRIVTEIGEVLEDGRLKIWAHDPRDDAIVTMAVTFHEPPPPKPKSGRTRAKVERPRMTPELRMQIETGLRCKQRGHDLTAKLPNGKPGFYINKGGTQVCRWCKQEAVDRWKESNVQGK